MLRLGVGLSLVLAVVGCEREPKRAPSGAEPRVTAATLSGRLAKSLRDGDANELNALAAKDPIDVRVEIRQALVETDERKSETLASAADLRDWLVRGRAKWTCKHEECEWPGGLVTGDLARCVGDCCFSDYPGGIEKKTLYLKRACFTAREGDQPRLSYIAFVEAK